MKAVKLLSVAIIVLFVMIVFLAPVGEALNYPPKTVVGNPTVTADAKGAEVRVYFRGTALSATRPMGNSSAETKNCPGKSPAGARMFGVNVGTWKMTIGGDTVVSGAVSAVIWAGSKGGAKNAGFRINFMRSGGNTQSIFTNRQTLQAEPVKFTATGTYSQTFSHGDTFDVGLVWLSDPQHGIGPAGSGEFYYGNAQYDSSIKLTFNANPIKITNITTPVKSVSTMDVKAEFQDILGADPSSLTYSLAITGKTTAQPTSIGAPKPSASGGNKSSVTWTWMHAKDNAQDGDYTFTCGISYDGNSTSINETTMNVDFPSGGGGKGGGNIFGGLGGGGSMQMILILVLVIVIVVVVAVVVVLRNRGKKKKKGKKDEDEEEEEEEEEEEA